MLYLLIPQPEHFTTTLRIIIGICIILSIVATWLAARKTPMGWQDKKGFHTGSHTFNPDEDEMYW